MSVYIDQLNRKVNLDAPPKRIVSLVPSQTELLADLGLSDKLAGITKYCIYPPDIYLSTPHIGGTKNFNIERIKTLKPDLIIGNKEENTKKLIDELEEEFPVWMSDVSDLHEAMEMIYCVGSITGTLEKAEEIIKNIHTDFEKLRQTHTAKKPKALYLIWRKPYISVGANTFIHDMMERCGFHNVLVNKTRYPELSAADIKSLNPEIILLSTEPYPFREKHFNEFKAICPKAKFVLAEGEYFSWYGSRLVNACSYFQKFKENVF